MAGEVQASQHDRAAQVTAAQTTAEALAQTNAQLKQASLEAAEARDAAQHANRAKSDFLAVMSHELRTPLNAIGGYAEILGLGIYGPVTEKQREAITRITRSQQTLLTLINDVLNFAKLEAGEVHYTITDVPLVDTLTGMEALIDPQLRDRGLAYTVQGCGDRVTVRADRDKLQQIVLNLLSNAIKFTPNGGSIALGCSVTGSVVRIDVRDTGIGIAPERVRTIFDPFVQAGRALNRPHDGVGLGLSISRDLATAMSGELSVESVVGEGSTFTLTLPAGRPLAGLD
jgi:signal transduction histidine kinase